MTDEQAMRYVSGLDRRLRAFGIPIRSVGLEGNLPPAIVTFDPAATPADITRGVAIVATYGASPYRKRTLLAIRADLVALTGPQKNAVWADITSGSPPKWSTISGVNAGAIGVLTLLGASGTLSAADVLEAKIRGVAMYCQDNPSYLVNPVFDPTINVPGDEPDV